MNKCGILSVAMVGTLFLGTLVYFPVFADNPVNISIVEKVDDGSGGYKNWEDITGAMPGATYSAIPRVRNDGAVPVAVRMCISESATNSLGETIMLPANTFGIEINEHWEVDTEGVVDSSDPAAGNCYDYNSMIEAGAVTEPLFTEVSLSSELGNEHENSTFALHLDAEARGDLPPNPDTGFNTVSYFDIVKPVCFATGGVALFAIVAFILRRVGRKH